MKKLLIIAIALMPFLLWSQQTLEGFNYQALAVDENGEIIKNKELAVKVELLSAKENGEVHYQELHMTKSSDYGVINIVIGTGDELLGTMYEVPWENESVWVNIQFDFDLDGQFGTSNYSKLLAVPYALYAKKAGEVQSFGRDGGKFDPTDELYWETDGNERIEEGDVLGTINLIDLVVVTGGEERVRYGIRGNTKHYSDNEFIGKLDVWEKAVFQDSVIVESDVVIEGVTTMESNLFVNANVEINNDLIVKDDLHVWEDVNISGSTEIIRNLDVRNNLQIDGLSLFTNPLNSITKDDGSIVVEGGIGIEKNVNIGGNFTQDDPTDNAILGKVLVTNTTESSSKDIGSLVVEGGVGIEKNVNIGGDFTQDDPTDNAILGKVLVTNTTESSSKDAGSLVVEGGVGVEKNINLGGDLIQDDITDNAILGKVMVTDTTQSQDKDSGALIVEGGLGVEKDVNIGGSLEVGGDLIGSGLVINGARTGPDDEWDSYPVQVTGKTQGVAIKITESSNSENNFLTFFNEDEQALGRIEGQTKVDILESPVYIVETTFQAAAIASSIGSLVTQAATATNVVVQTGRWAVDLVNHIIAIIGAGIGSVETGGGVGDLICVLAIAIIDLSYEAVELAGAIIAEFLDFTVTAFDAATNIANFIQYQVQVFLNSGSTFSSGSADYAEYIIKANPSDKFSPGDVVGIAHGQLVKDLTQADKLMVVSSDPIVLGNMPMDGEEHLYEKVAFMGQVPVKVLGPVNSGDYLVADLDNMGYAKPISKDDLSLDDIDHVVGVSWGASQLNGMNYVNAAIGLNDNDVVPVLKNQVQEIQALKSELNELKKYVVGNHNVLSELIPGYKEKVGDLDIEYDPTAIEEFNREIETLASVDIKQEMMNTDLYDLLNSYSMRRGDSYVHDLDNAEIISMVNKIDTKHGLNLDLFAAPAPSQGPFTDVENAINNLMNTDFIKEFKDEVELKVSVAAQAIADEILAVKDEMLEQIAQGANLTTEEKNMLAEKLNEMLPIFELMENVGDLVTDITNEICAIIDEATCKACALYELVPVDVDPDTLLALIEIPINFTLGAIDFFVSTLDVFRDLSIGDEVCLLGECVSFNIEPFGFIPNFDFNVDDLPFVDNKQVNIQFPHFCKRLQCN